MAVFSWLWNGLKWLGSLFLPFLAIRKFRSLGKVLRWVLHFAILAVMLGCLWYLNYFFDLERSLRSSWTFLHPFWLPLLFLLFYILCWLGYWLWNLLGPEALTLGFPEIDAAWSKAEQALQQASLDITEAPVFLVLGRPAAGEEALFNASRIPLAVQKTPHADAPFHVYANRDAVFVSITACSLLGHQARLYQEKPAAPVPMPLVTPTPAAAGDGPAAAAVPSAPSATPTPAPGEVPQAAPSPKPAARPLLKNKEVMEHLRAQLQHLCRHIAGARRPYSPINGILVLLPLAGSDSDVDASHVATLCQMDLQAIRDVLQVECPVYVLACDLERLPGFREFLETMPQAQRWRSLGRTFPLVPDIDPPELPSMFDSGVNWLCQDYLASMIYPQFQLEAGAPESPGQVPEALRKTMRLYQFLAEMRQRHARLGRMVYRSTLVDAGSSPMVAGLYLAGTGIDAAHEQAFVSGVFAELVAGQNFVSWTPQALSDEASFRRITRFGYAGLGAIVLGAFSVAFFFVWQR